MKLSLVFILIGLTWHTTTFAQSVEVPTIKNGRIIFNNGKIIEIEKKLLKDDGPKANKGLYSIIKPILVNEWKRLILIKKIVLYEDSAKRISVLNFDGEPISTPLEYMGDVIILSKTKRILLAQQSAHFITKESFILNENGKIIRKIYTDKNAFEFDHSTDDNIFWVLSSHVDRGKPITNIEVYNSDGEFIQSASTYKKIKFKLIYEGIVYEIFVPEPDFPG